MRLVTYATPDGPRPGAVVAAADGDRLLDLGHVGGSVTALLSDDVAMASVRAALAAGPTRPEAPGDAPAAPGVGVGTDPSSLPALDPAALLAPVVPGKMLCLGYNYRGHVPDGAEPEAEPEYPDVFVKTPNTFGGPNDLVAIPPGATDVDYEGEVAVVIGRRAQRVSIEDALDHVAGYTILNDVSDRAWQRRQSQWALGKCSDGFAPIGPWIVTADDVPDPQDLLVEVVRDGEVTVSQSTSTTIFSVAFVIHHLSQVLTLEPGDIVSTGTPQKLPAAQQAHRPLAAGDAVMVRISGIGELTTRFTSPLTSGLTTAAPDQEATA